MLSSLTNQIFIFNAKVQLKETLEAMTDRGTRAETVKMNLEFQKKVRWLGVGSEWKEKEEEDKDDALKDSSESNTRTNSHITKIV